MKSKWGGGFFGFFCLWNVINVPLLFFFFRDVFLDLDFGLRYEGKLGRERVSFFVYGTSLTFLFLLLFRGRFPGARRTIINSP
jgi:hypothetical protein